MCAPGSRCLQSLAYEPLAVFHLVESFAAAWDQNYILIWLRRESVCCVSVRSSIPTHTIRALRGLGRPKALPTNPLLCQKDAKSTVIPDAPRAIRDLESTAGPAITRPATVPSSRPPSRDPATSRIDPRRRSEFRFAIGPAPRRRPTNPITKSPNPLTPTTIS